MRRRDLRAGHVINRQKHGRRSRVHPLCVLKNKLNRLEILFQRDGVVLVARVVRVGRIRVDAIRRPELPSRERQEHETFGRIGRSAERELGFIPRASGTGVPVILALHTKHPQTDSGTVATFGPVVRYQYAARSDSACIVEVVFARRLEADRGRFDVPLATALSYGTRAGQLLGWGRARAALDDARTAVELGPDDPRTRRVLAAALARNGLQADAHREEETAKRLKPGPIAGEMILQADAVLQEGFSRTEFSVSSPLKPARHHADVGGSLVFVRLVPVRIPIPIRTITPTAIHICGTPIR